MAYRENKIIKTMEGEVIIIKTKKEYDRKISKGLVIVDFNTEWCGPCKIFSPIFEKLAKKYPNTVFLSVDPEKFEHSDCENIKTVPTFKIFFGGELRREFSGIDRERLEGYIKRYQIQIYYNGVAQKSFTLKDQERIKQYMKSFTSENTIEG